ncbi:putative 26S Proteasome non-ATPase regulatory subunit 13 [Helianthus annuus]|nr:putative 26S Proteasome non-ATPase regulatory subunit 13 [Helianthus annuus]
MPTIIGCHANTIYFSATLIKSRLGSPYEWLTQMLEAFNSGSLVRYQELCILHKTSVDAELALVENEKKLTTIKRHNCSFDYHCKGIFQVHLIEGMIDGVDGTVHVSWVQLRVLGMTQITFLRHRLDDWLGKVQWVIMSLETGTPEFVSHLIHT